MSETAVDRQLSPTLGEDGEPCAECGGRLARDQRYCLNCGHRRAEARIPFLDVLREEYGGGREPLPEPVAPEEPEKRRTGLTPLATAGVSAAVGVLLIAGVLVGLLAQRGEEKTAAAPPPQVIQVPAAAPAQPVAAAELVEDWPEGQSGWTVQLQALPKETNQVPTVLQAKQAATAKGAPEVGALDSDNYSTLEAGSYIVYSGVFDNAKQAKAALRDLKKDFPDAKVVEVSSEGDTDVASDGGDKDALSGKKESATVDKKQLEELQNLSPEEYSKQSRKLPDETKLPGKPPAEDNKQPGAGSDAQTIK